MILYMEPARLHGVWVLCEWKLKSADVASSLSKSRECGLFLNLTRERHLWMHAYVEFYLTVILISNKFTIATIDALSTVTWICTTVKLPIAFD